MIRARRRLFLPENYLSAIGLKEKSKVSIEIGDDQLILRNPEREAAQGEQ